MLYRPLKAMVMLMIVLVLAGPAKAQQKAPFTLDQVKELIHGGIGDETGAKLIVQRGISFVITDDIINSLKASGANQAFLEALRAAKAPSSQNAPMTQIQVLTLVANSIPHHHIAQLVHDRGLAFEPTPTFLREIRLAGADDEIVKALQAATVTKPGAVSASSKATQEEVQKHAARGGEFLQNKQYPQAETEYRAAIQLDPNNPDLHLNLGIVLSNENDQDGAIREYREAIRLDPNNDQAHINLGNRLRYKNDEDGAMREYKEAIRISPNNEDAHTALGDVYMDEKDWDDCITEYKTALRINPNNDESHLTLGVAYSQKGDQDSSIAEYREAIRINPRYEQAHINLGNRLSFKKDYDGALAEYSEAVRLNPKNDLAHYDMGLMYENKGNTQMALQEYRTAADLNPKDPDYQKAYEELKAKGN